MTDVSPSSALDTALLVQAAAALGVPLTEGQLAAFGRYAELLVDWNQRVNLTRLTHPDEIAIQLFADSLACLGSLPPDETAPETAVRCVDVGAGAGLPGLALKLVRPPWQVTLVESVGKKVAFMTHVIDALALADTVAVHARAEEVGRDTAHRARYDVALARAVASLPVLAEYLLPLVRVGGRMIAWKGAEIEAEVAALDQSLILLGGRRLAIQPYTLPGLDAPRQLVIVEKTRPTAAAYPRRPGAARARPLG